MGGRGGRGVRARGQTIVQAAGSEQRISTNNGHRAGGRLPPELLLSFTAGPRFSTAAEIIRFIEDPIRLIPLLQLHQNNSSNKKKKTTELFYT